MVEQTLDLMQIWAKRNEDLLRLLGENNRNNAIIEMPEE